MFLDYVRIGRGIRHCIGLIKDVLFKVISAGKYDTIGIEVRSSCS